LDWIVWYAEIASSSFPALCSASAAATSSPIVLTSAPGIGPGSRCSVSESTGILLELTSAVPCSGRKFGASATMIHRPERTPIIANRPLSSVVEVMRALTASLVARTVAPLIAFPSGSLMVPMILPAVCADAAAASASVRVARMQIRRMGGSYSKGGS
jgi:hypothetical protein